MFIFSDNGLTCDDSFFCVTWASFHDYGKRQCYKWGEYDYGFVYTPSNEDIEVLKFNSFYSHFHKKEDRNKWLWEKRTFGDDVIDSVNWRIVHFRNFCVEISGTLHVIKLTVLYSTPTSLLRSYRSIFFVFPCPINFNLFLSAFPTMVFTSIYNTSGLLSPNSELERFPDFRAWWWFWIPGRWIPSKILRLASGFWILLHWAEFFLLSS